MTTTTMIRKHPKKIPFKELSGFYRLPMGGAVMDEDGATVEDDVDE